MTDFTAATPTTPRRPTLVPMLNRALLGTCIALVAPFGFAMAADGSGYRIEAITLSSGGLAEIRRGVSITDGAKHSFDVPLDQVSDILKSLLVYDGAGGVASVSLDGPSSLEETFRGLPFTRDDITALPRLLGALQGIPVRVASGGRTVEGMVLGVEFEPAAEDEKGERTPILSIMTEAGQIAVLRLRSDTQLDILDETMRDKLRTVAVASGKTRVEDTRTISIALQNGEPRDVWLDYVVPAPIWKTSYRLILDAEGTARLQAWAIIENATGEDWSNVGLTLSSGTPVTLSQRLYDRYWSNRYEVPVVAQSEAPVTPDQYKSAEFDENVARFASGSVALETMAIAPAPASAPMTKSPSRPVEQAAAAEGQTAATYQLPGTIDLAAGQTLSVPYIDADLSAERIALFQPERGATYPIAAIRLKNTTAATLPPGIVTVYAPNEEGYAGDAQLMGLPTDETRMLSFAADRKVEISTEQGRDQTSYRATLAEGVLRVSSTTLSQTTYTVKGAADAPRTVIIEQPRRDGWVFASDALVETTPTHYRLRVEVKAGATAEVKVSFSRDNSEKIALVDTDSNELLYWSSLIKDPKTTAVLADLVERRQALSRAEAALDDISSELNATTDGQARIRDNLAAVPKDSTLAQRYLSTLEAQEDQIAALETRRQQAEHALTEARATFARYVQAL